MFAGMNAPARAADFAAAAATAARMPPAPHRFTVDDVRAMIEAGLIDRDANIELLDGELIDMPSEGELHLMLKALLVRWFARNLADEWRVMPDGTLHLSKTDTPEPDLYVFAVGAQLEPIDPAQAPLVVEIADSSLAHDLMRKPGKYAAYGIAEYWVVDGNARRTHVFRDPANGAYAPAIQVAFTEALTTLRLSLPPLLIADLT